MKKINFTQHVLPHLLATVVFLIVTITFFNPIFFDRKALSQHDIQQWEGSSKAIRDYRDKTGDEPLWAPAMFSGMPAYFINVEWGNSPVSFLKRVLSLSLPHPIANVFLAFICYYIMLLAFGVRPYLAIAGAIAFGLSSYMIIGLVAGHNGRIGAIAFMPLVMAGIHLTFSGKKILGFGLTTAALALHLRENHIQITYYLFLIVAAYGVIQLIDAVKEKKLPAFFKTIGLLTGAACIAIGTFFGPFWAVTEYSNYSTRGKSELVTQQQTGTSGLSKAYAFDYSNGILDPMTLVIPNFYGGQYANFLVRDTESNVYKALMRSGNEQLANQLAGYTSAYWGTKPTTAPYYAGAVIVFLFVVGIAFAEKKYVLWLVPISVLAIMMTWGDSFSSFNYFLFDYLPGYNKFRSPTFTLIITLFALPLLGFIGLEKVMTQGLTKESKRKLLLALGATGGLCLLLLLTSGMFSFLREDEHDLPVWFTNALADDRKSLFRSDTFRTLSFMVAIFIVMYFEVWKKISPIAFYALLIVFTTFDITVISKRFITKDNYQRKQEKSTFAISEADQAIAQDKDYFRVLNLQGTMSEARTSYFHNSIGGYHGVKLRRYQDLYDSCLAKETNALVQDAQSGTLDFEKYNALKMLNARYVVYGPQRTNIILNDAALGNAWFIRDVIAATSATEELKKLSSIDTRYQAVINTTKFTVPDFSYDSMASITLQEEKPNYLKYETESSADGFGVFSEIYYPAGWKASIDGKESEIIQTNYTLRGLPIPAGKHTIEFTFKPAAYTVGNTVTMASSWLMFLILAGSIGWSFRKGKDN